MPSDRFDAAPVLALLSVSAGWVFFVNTRPGPWLKWSQGTTIDGWTATHLAYGSLANVLGVPLSTTMMIGALNELLETILRANRPDLSWGEPETPSNVMTDIIANGAGWLITSQILQTARLKPWNPNNVTSL